MQDFLWGRTKGQSMDWDVECGAFPVPIRDEGDREVEDINSRALNSNSQCDIRVETIQVSQEVLEVFRQTLSTKYVIDIPSLE